MRLLYRKCLPRPQRYCRTSPDKDECCHCKEIIEQDVRQLQLLKDRQIQVLKQRHRCGGSDPDQTQARSKNHKQQMLSTMDAQFMNLPSTRAPSSPQYSSSNAPLVAFFWISRWGMIYDLAPATMRQSANSRNKKLTLRGPRRSGRTWMAGVSPDFCIRPNLRRTKVLSPKQSVE